MASNSIDSSKSGAANPIIALWEKIPASIRLPIFAVIILAALILVKMDDGAPPTQKESPAVTVEKTIQLDDKKTSAPEIEKFTGAFVEWPEGDIEAYVTHYIDDDQVLVSMSNVSTGKNFFIDQIHLRFKNEAGKIIDTASMKLERVLKPGEKTGLFNLQTENSENLSTAELNKKVRIVDVELEMKEKRASSSSI